MAPGAVLQVSARCGTRRCCSAPRSAPGPAPADCVPSADTALERLHHNEQVGDTSIAALLAECGVQLPPLVRLVAAEAKFLGVPSWQSAPLQTEKKRPTHRSLVETGATLASGCVELERPC